MLFFSMYLMLFLYEFLSYEFYMKYLEIYNTIHVAVINISIYVCDLEPFSKIQSHTYNYL